jgi:hypothetical protein
MECDEQQHIDDLRTPLVVALNKQRIGQQIWSTQGRTTEIQLSYYKGRRAKPKTLTWPCHL